MYETALWNIFSHLPADWDTKRPFGMTTLSSEFLAQSTMPLRPFMGKLMSVITDTAGSLWMLATAEFKNTDQPRHADEQCTYRVFLRMQVVSWKIILDPFYQAASVWWKILLCTSYVLPLSCRPSSPSLQSIHLEIWIKPWLFSCVEVEKFHSAL